MKWLALLIFGGIGAGVLVGGILWGLKRYALFRDGRRTSGTVVAQEESRATTRKSGRTVTEVSYFPVVEFEALGGERVRFTGSTGGGNKPLLEMGTEVVVLYNPARPADAQISSFSQFWLGPVTLAACGGVFLVMGIAGFFLIRDSDRTFGPSFQANIDRHTLLFRQDSLRVQGRASAFRPDPERRGAQKILVCRARMTEDGPLAEFESEPVPAGFGVEFLDRPVTIYLDPQNPERYYVDLGPLLSEYHRRRVEE